MYQLDKPAPERSPERGTAPPTGRPRITFRPIALLGWLLVTFLLATGPLHMAVPDQSGSAYFSAAALGGLAVLGVLLVADLRRARAMTASGLSVERIELGLLRGRVIASGEPSSPEQMRRVSWTGPRVITAAAVLLGGSGWALTLASSPGLRLLGATAAMTAIGLALIGVSELLPAPGSAGSELIFARAWRRTGKRDAASAAVGRAGVRTGWALIVIGAALTALVTLGGLWIMLVGGFVLAGSKVTLAGAHARERLSGLTVAEVMSPAPPEVSSFATAGAAFTEVAVPSRAPVLVARDPDGSLAGIVPTAALAAVPGDDRELVRVRRMAVPPSALVLVRRSEPAGQVLERLGAQRGAGLAVVLADDDPSQVVGIVSAADIARTVQWMDAAAGGDAQRSAPSWLPRR